ncbi:hypothetical protein [Sphaerisporangium aureirubrum]|uniref:Uncharacterized protein n=1 Tax=Sphaerisporangium aureirubrum TaxID=1544736 RepID=A0ABW1NNG6_9ACTN
METFLFDLLSSVSVTALTVVAGWVTARWARRLPGVLLGRLMGLGVVRVYRRQAQANADLPAALSRARWVKVLAGRGNEMTRDGFGPVWERAEGPQLDFVEVLLPDPVPGAPSWLSRRAAEVHRVDMGFTPALLASQVCLNAAYIEEIARRTGKVRLRFYELPNLHRVILTDEVAYLTIYRSDRHGRNSPCLVARRPGALYDYAASLFATAWESSRPIEQGTGRATPPAEPRRAVDAA